MTNTRPPTHDNEPAPSNTLSAPRGSAPSTNRLEKGVLRVPNAITLSAAAMAPVLAVVLNAPAAVGAAGAALPLSFLLAFAAAALVGNTVVQFARRLPSAGSFYTFNAQGLGPAAGFFTGWFFWIGYAILEPGLCSAFGAFVEDYVRSTFGVTISWWIFSLAAMAIVMGLSLRSIKASVNVDLVLLCIEVIIFSVLAFIAVSTAGPSNTVSVFLPSSSPTGFSGVGLGVVFGLLSFVGFDAAATLGEETRNPKRSIPLAIIGALGAVGVFYVFVMYALTAGYGVTVPSHLAEFLQDSNPFLTMAAQIAPWLLQPIEIAAIFGIFSCFLAIHSTTVRVMFSMGRDRVLPGALGRVHARWFSPHRAIYAQTTFTVVVASSVGLWLGPGATGAYGFTGAIGTVAIIIVYMLSSIALIRYFWHTPERKRFRHIVVPALGVVALAYPLYSVAAPGQAYPYNLVLIVVGVWVIAGTALYLYYRAKSPEKIAALGSFTAEEDVPHTKHPEAQRPRVAEQMHAYSDPAGS